MKVSKSLRFGDIYYLPVKYAPKKRVGNHWVVVLYSSEEEGIVIFKVLSSRIFWLFSDFGFFVDAQCQSCESFRDFRIQQKIGNFNKNKELIDIDCATFLNYTKYSFLNKSTFLLAKDLYTDNYFDFYTKVTQNKYRACGTLLQQNMTNAVVTIRYSSDLSVIEKRKIMNFYSPGPSKVKL